MKIDASFQSNKQYDVQQDMDVVLGQKFLLTTDSTLPLRWLSENDPVLAIDVQVDPNGPVAAVEATGLGISTVYITDLNFGPIRKLFIKVVDAIVEPASTLNPAIGAAVPKT